VCSFPFFHYLSYNVRTDTFLQINDQINIVLTRYDAFKKGDFSFASNPIPQEFASGSGSSSQGISLIDFDDSAPASSETTGGGGVGNDLSGLFSYLAQPTQAQAQYQPQQQQQQQQPPSTHAPTPLFFNNNGGMNTTFMQSTPNTMTPHNRQLSGTPPASIALPQSKPGSQRSTPVPAAAPTPNYFGNAGPRGPVGGMGVNRGMGGGLPMSGINVGGGAMNLSGSMSGMSLNGGGGGGNMGMGLLPQSTTIPQQPKQATTTPAPAPPPSSGTDPFADLAGLF
jgi:ADP-ribosylation factor-binding protein GGA